MMLYAGPTFAGKGFRIAVTIRELFVMPAASIRHNFSRRNAVQESTRVID
jgi:hypothetical protein